MPKCDFNKVAKQLAYGAVLKLGYFCNAILMKENVVKSVIRQSFYPN